MNTHKAIFTNVDTSTIKKHPSISVKISSETQTLQKQIKQVQTQTKQEL